MGPDARDTPRISRLGRDAGFYFALAAAPIVWLLLYGGAQLGYLPLIKPAPDLQYLGANWRYLLLVCLIYPVLEELAFRGALQTWLHRFRWGAVRIARLSGANIGTTAVFALAHLMYHPPLWSLLVIAPSLVFGHFRDKYGSVLPGVLLHCLYNTGYYALFRQA